MKRCVKSFKALAPACALALALAWCAPAVRAQTPEQRAAESPSQGEHGEMEAWKWVNFLLLAGAIGYYIRKNGAPFFAARTRKIRKELVEAEDLRASAETRVADVERRMANLEAEIAALRAEAQKEEQAESSRFAQQTAAEIAKVQAHAEQEIAAAGKAARLELKRHAAELAVGLAAEKIRARMTPETQDALVRGFVRHLQ
jgi:F-type H+-transporting ATPase subunit b